MAQRTLANLFLDGLFGLNGRMNRSDFWLSSVALFMAAVLFTIVLNSTIRHLFDVPWWGLLLVVLAIQLLVAWPTFAVTVKRGHDRGFSVARTFWVNVVAHVVPIGLIVVPIFLDRRPQWQGAFWVFAVLSIYMIFDYGILPGTKGPNKYGPSTEGSIDV